MSVISRSVHNSMGQLCIIPRSQQHWKCKIWSSFVSLSLTYFQYWLSCTWRMWNTQCLWWPWPVFRFIRVTSGALQKLVLAFSVELFSSFAHMPALVTVDLFLRSKGSQKKPVGLFLPILNMNLTALYFIILCF